MAEFDEKKFEKEIEARLKNIPRDKCVAFAVRCAMRVLPLLVVAKKEKTGIMSMFNQKPSQVPFWFWSESDRNRHLLAVLRAYACSIQFSLTGIYTASANIQEIQA